MKGYLPTRQQWKDWSLPSRLTAIGTYVGLVGLMLAILFFAYSELRRGAPSKAPDAKQLAEKAQNEERVHPTDALRVVRTELDTILSDPAAHAFRLFEIIRPALRDVGFQGSRIQMHGDDHVGVNAFRPSPADGKPEVWGFEFRKAGWLTADTGLTPRMFSSETGRWTFDRFVIVVPDDISAVEHAALSRYYLSMPLVIVTPDVLSELVLGSKEALDQLKLPFQPVPSSLESLRRYEYHHRATVSLDVVHQLNLPYSVDYIDGSNMVVKAFNENEFRLLLMMGNHTSDVVTVHSLKAKTVGYSPDPARFLRIHRPLGILEPIEITFSPSTTVGGETLLLENKVWQLNPDEYESSHLTLSDGTLPGLYQFYIEAEALRNGRKVIRRSPTINLNVRGPSSNYISLQASTPPTGGRVSVAVVKLLTMDDAEWTSLKDDVQQYDYALLGPRVMDYENETSWLVRGGDYKERVKLPDGSTGLIPDHANDRIILDLHQEIYPPYHPVIEASELQWADMFLLQMARRSVANPSAERD